MLRSSMLQMASSVDAKIIRVADGVTAKIENACYRWRRVWMLKKIIRVADGVTAKIESACYRLRRV